MRKKINNKKKQTMNPEAIGTSETDSKKFRSDNLA